MSAGWGHGRTTIPSPDVLTRNQNIHMQQDFWSRAVLLHPHQFTFAPATWRKMTDFIPPFVQRNYNTMKVHKCIRVWHLCAFLCTDRIAQTCPSGHNVDIVHHTDNYLPTYAQATTRKYCQLKLVQNLCETCLPSEDLPFTQTQYMVVLFNEATRSKLNMIYSEEFAFWVAHACDIPEKCGWMKKDANA